MATLDLVSARVLADGRIVQLTFEADPVPAEHSMPDWREGFAADKRLTLSTDAELEFVGAWATPWDRPYFEPATQTHGDPGDTPVTGAYYVAYSLTNTGTSEEEFFSPVVQVDLSTAGRRIRLLRMEGVHQIPEGYTANIYVSEPDGGPETLTLYRSGVARATEVYLDVVDRVWADDEHAWPGPARLAWTAHWLVTDPAEVVTIEQTGLTVTAPAGLLADGAGNATGAFAAEAVDNESLVDADGFTSDLFERGAGGYTVYVSSTHGDDERDLTAAQDPTTPVATPSRADTLLGSARDNGSAIRFLRGDTFELSTHIYLPGYAGPDKFHPAVFESYWHPSFGADPGTRPVLTRAGNSVFRGTGTGGLSHTVVRGLHVATGGVDLNAIFGTNNLTFDDNVFEAQATVYNSSGVTFLRNIFRDIYDESSHSQAIFMYGNGPVLISQNTYDFVGRKSEDLQAADIYSHANYHQFNNRPMVFWGNWVREGGSHGVQMRAGGVAAYNVFTRNAIGAFIAAPGGYFYKNIIEKGRDIVSAGESVEPRGYGYEVPEGRIDSTGNIVEFNLILNEEGTGNGVSLLYTRLAANLSRDVKIRNNTVSRAGEVVANVFGSAPSGTYAFDSSANILSSPSSLLLKTNHAGDWTWYNSDHNALHPPESSQTSLGTLATWKSTTGSEASSVEGDPAFADDDADLGDYYTEGDEQDYVDHRRDRPAGTWDQWQPTQPILAFYGERYLPTALDPIGDGEGPWDYYGAADYREIEPDEDPPEIGSAATNTAGTQITAGLSETGCTPASGSGGFTLTGTTATVASWAIAGSTLTLTLDGAIEHDETVLLAYASSGASEPIEDAAGNPLADFGDLPVTNNVPDPDPEPGPIVRIRPHGARLGRLPLRVR